MIRPKCSLCDRIGARCEYPTRRRFKRTENAETPRTPVPTEKMERLLHLLDEGLLNHLTTDVATQNKQRDRTPFSCLPASSSAQSPPDIQLTSTFDLDGFDNTSLFEVFSDDEITVQGTYPMLSTNTNALGPAQGFSSVADLSLDLHTLMDCPENPWKSISPYYPANVSLGTGNPSRKAFPSDPETNSTYSTSHDMARHLIDLYFEKIQGFLPLFHRPNFYARYITNEQYSLAYHLEHVDESALLLYVMLGLSARFSTKGLFRFQAPEERGKPFMEKAKELFQKEHRKFRECLPSLQYLQSAILLAFDTLMNVPSYQGWIETGTCCCIAFDLDLQDIDFDIIHDGVDQASLDDADWVLREEKRRAWWTVWEMDIFVSTMFCRPATIPQDRIAVLLPVSDTVWFQNKKLSSTHFGSNPVLTWSCMQGCPNQNERAWYLLSAFVFRLLHDLTLVPAADSSAREPTLYGARFFLLALPQKMQVENGNFFFDEANFQRSNWVICMNILVQW